MANKPHTFEQDLKSLEALVAKMESGNLPLEDALKQYSDGVTLIKKCQSFLEDAKQKIDTAQ